MGKYSISPEWSDVEPIPLHDDPNSATYDSSVQPLATIAYAPAYSEAMAYLRAVMAANEFSDRTLSLTEDIINMNPAHYTVWLYRAQTIRELNKDIYAELKWLEGVSRKNLKNYQIWHHRQSLITTLATPPPHEAAFLTSILALDTKNYHVWTYRQWLCARFPDEYLHHPSELRRTEDFISRDVRNNSAWNHRWFLVFGAHDLQNAGDGGVVKAGMPTSKPGGRGVGLLVVDEEVVEREVEYTQGKIEVAPMNQSAWNYLRGVLRRAGRELSHVEPFCERFVGVGEGEVEIKGVDGQAYSGVRSSHAVEWLGEIRGARGDIEGAGRCWDVLGRKWDPVRRAYWEYRRRRLEDQWTESQGVGKGGGQDVAHNVSVPV